jgi:hypothetical protein
MRREPGVRSASHCFGPWIYLSYIATGSAVAFRHTPGSQSVSLRVILSRSRICPDARHRGRPVFSVVPKALRQSHLALNSIYLYKN